MKVKVFRWKVSAQGAAPASVLAVDGVTALRVARRRHGFARPYVVGSPKPVTDGVVAWLPRLR